MIDCAENLFVGSKCPTAHSEFRHKYNSVLNQKDYICFQSNFLLRTSVQLPTLAVRNGETEKFPCVLAWFKNHKLIGIVLCVSQEEFQAEVISWDKASRKDSSKRKVKHFFIKTQTNLVVICSWETLPRQGAFRMTAQLSKPYITGSTFTICNSIKVTKQNP